MPITLLDPADRLLDLPPQPLGPSAPAKPTGDPGEFLWNGAGLTKANVQCPTRRGGETRG